MEKALEIWQLRWDCENRHEIAWMDFNDIEDRFSMDNYECVYKMDISEKYIDPEEAFEIFNIHRPRDFKGHSLSVSDILIYPEQQKALYCDSIGFKDISDKVLRKKSVTKQVADVTAELTKFAEDFDYYEYLDTIDETMPDIISMDLAEGRITGYMDYLKEIAANDEQEPEIRIKAADLISKIDDLGRYQQKEFKVEEEKINSYSVSNDVNKEKSNSANTKYQSNDLKKYDDFEIEK